MSPATLRRVADIMVKHGIAALALDFDGVICDSMDECLVAAANARANLRGEGEVVRSVSDLPEPFVRHFRRLRYLVGPAGEFGLLLDLIEQGVQAVDRAEFRAMALERRREVQRFASMFFEARRQHMAEDLGGWLRLHRMYDAFQSGYERWRKQVPIYLVTTKDCLSVGQFNQSWNLGLDAARMWTKERFDQKSDALKGILDELACPPSSLLFVDDNLDHLADASASGCTCIWASWGYTPQAEYDGSARRIDNMEQL
jgi:phosphoglycolate phosphatase-like HAD superfamily hydrolase